MGSLQLKLAVLLSALVAGAVLLTGLVAERSLREQEHGRLARALTEEARLVRGWAGEGPIGVARRDALQALAERAAEAAAARVTFLAPDGTVVADSDVPRANLPEVENHATRPEVAAALAGAIGQDRRLSATVALPFFYVAVPVDGGRGGAVRLALDTAFLDADLAALRRRLALAGAVGLGMAVLAAWAASGTLVRPLRDLRGAMAALVAGDFRHRFAWSTRDELGDIARAVNDLAEQLRARVREVAAENERLQAVLQGMVEGVLVLDSRGRVVLANGRLRDLFDVWGDVGGRPPLEVIRRADVHEALQQAAQGSEPVLREIALGDRALQMHAVRFPAQGVLLGSVAVFHDVTEIRRLEEIRKEFVANVSHELKTPLTAIRGFAETLQQEGLPEAKRREYVEVIRRHAGRLGALIDDLLELSRIEGRRHEVARAEVDVASVARGVVGDLRPRLESRRLEARLSAAGDTRALADRRAVEQVLTNLLENAIKYTEPGGSLFVRVTGEGARVRLDVEDTGIGIPEADQARIFERFYRVDKARSRDLGGTGLGLAIVKHLVQAMEGEVYVESKEGDGSTFTVLLPRAAAAPPEAGRTAEEPSPGSGGPRA